MMLFLLSEPLTQGLVLESRKLVSDYSAREVALAFWNLNDGFPICYQLWFIRDLMVIMILSPAIYWAVKHLGRYFLWATAIAWLAKLNLNVEGLNLTTILFFSTGAYFGVSGKNFVVEAKQYAGWAAALYVALAIADTCMLHQPWHWYINRAATLVGIVATIGLTARFITANDWQTIPHLAGIGFFMYAFHGMPLTLTTKLTYKAFDPQGDLSTLGLYLLCPTIVLIVGLCCYYLIRRFMPRLMDIITGGR